MTLIPGRKALWLGGRCAFGVLICLHGTSVAEEKSRSPFHRSPADVAVEEPCRFMGTFHKEVRQRLEMFYGAKQITLPEWKCLSGALKKVDRETTASCKEAPQSIETIEVRQTELFSACLPESKRPLVDCSLLSRARPALLGSKSSESSAAYAACFLSSD
jgi:hypothetical protein